METLNLLKFWRNPIRNDNVVNAVFSGIDYVNSDITNPTPEYDSDDDDDDDSFFELELNTTRYGNEQDAKLVESPRDVFRNARVFPFDSPFSSKPQSPKSSLKSAPKFKVFMLGFKKSKESSKPGETGQSKRFVVEEVPVFSRDNCLRSKLLRENFQDVSVNENSPNKKSDKMKFVSSVIKPLYSMASKRYNADKLKFPESPVSSPRFSPATTVSSPVEKQLSPRSSGFRNVCKNLGKSKSAVSVASPVNRRDETLLQDGIQGAILHCKRSYNSPAKGTSDPATEKSEFGELMKRSSI